jgi:hypothetical protein
VNPVNIHKLIDATKFGRGQSVSTATRLTAAAIFIWVSGALVSPAQASDSMSLVMVSDVRSGMSARGFSQHNVANVDADAVAPNWLNKLLNPLHATLSELPNPFELLRSAHLKATQMRASQWQYLVDHAVWSEPIELLDVAHVPVIDISMKRPRAVQLQRQRSRLTNFDSMANGLAVPTMDASMPWARARPVPSPYRRSATQLQVRMDDGMSLLWELDRGNSLFSREEVGIGVGFRLNF